MKINEFKNYGPWILKSINSDHKNKQICEVQDCHRNLPGRFTMESTQLLLTRNVCKFCASHLTGLEIDRLYIVDTYIKGIKPHFNRLKNLSGMKVVPGSNGKNNFDKFYTIIGDYHLIITSFDSGGYMLIINNQPIPPSLNSSFKSKTMVTNHAVYFITNGYKDKIFNYIVHGQEFIMP